VDTRRSIAGCVSRTTRAARGEDRRKARELERVAEALLGAEDDRAAAERGAVPAVRRRRRDPVARHAKAPLVFRPAAREVTVEEPQLRAVRARMGCHGCCCDRPVEVRDGKVELAACLVREPDAGVGLRVIRIQSEHAAVARNRLVDAARGRVREAEVEQRGNPVGARGKRADVARRGIVVAA
jgi:hypothetical protein